MSNSIPFVVGYEVEEIGLGFGTNKNPSFTTPVIKEISTENFTNSVTQLLNNISAAFSKCDLGESNYDIGDIEISISVDVSGEVSVLSAAGLSTGSEAAMKINLRRKNGKD